MSSVVSKSLVFGIQLAVLLVISLAFFFWKGLALVLLFFPIWFDKAVLIHARVHTLFGIELITIPVVIAGVIYGPLFGFLFGFLILPLTGGIFEMISWLISSPMELAWLPVMPSLNSFGFGIAGLLAGMLSGVGFVYVVAVCAVVRNVVEYVHLRATSEMPAGIAAPPNVAFNIALAYLLPPYFPGGG